MAKYLILYNSPMSASEQMATASMEQMKASMAEWMAWRDSAEETAKIDFGMPLEAVERVTSEGGAVTDTQVSGYAIVEGDDKDAILDLLTTHPHLKRPNTSIDVLEMLSMPGM